MNALQTGDAATAADKLERAYQIVRLPTVGLWSARAFAKEGKLVTAEERYEDVIHWSGTASEMKQQAAAQATAAHERDELLPRLGSVTLNVEGASPSAVNLTLDGETVLAALIGTSLPVDPKHHVLRGTRGTEVVEQGFDVSEGQKTSVTLKFNEAPAPAAAPAAPTPPAPAPPATAPAVTDVGADHGSWWSPQRTLGVALGGAGVVAGVVSGVFTLQALSKKSDAGKYCHGSACTDSRGVDLLANAHSAGNVATIAGIAGLVLVGAGVTVFVTAPSGQSVAMAPSYFAGGGGLVATGTF